MSEESQTKNDVHKDEPENETEVSKSEEEVKEEQPKKVVKKTKSKKIKKKESTASAPAKSDAPAEASDSSKDEVSEEEVKLDSDDESDDQSDEESDDDSDKEVEELTEFTILQACFQSSYFTKKNSEFDNDDTIFNEMKDLVEQNDEVVCAPVTIRKFMRKKTFSCPLELCVDRKYPFKFIELFSNENVLATEMKRDKPLKEFVIKHLIMNIFKHKLYTCAEVKDYLMKYRDIFVGTSFNALFCEFVVNCHEEGEDERLIAFLYKELRWRAYDPKAKLEKLAYAENKLRNILTHS